MFFPLIQVEEARTKVSETSTRMYNSVLEAHEKSKDLDKTYKDLTKDVQGLNKEKESTDKQRSEAIQKRTQLELDDKDLREKMSVNIKAKEDAAKQLEILQREIQDSTEELHKITPLYDEKVIEEKEISKGYVCRTIYHLNNYKRHVYILHFRIMEREKQLSILYQKQGRATQFSSKASRDKWLQKEIDDLERVRSSNMVQVTILNDLFCNLTDWEDQIKLHHLHDKLVIFVVKL
ncbi:Structural maintenance of chromosomes protein 3 [Vitis vinifera]|uniref:Structural maintenance of chromosomes protein 3 n=1 Tax=Vitis vinifera TaxID=29760 RepID=A0A438C916_VITVI|nr:Structural maintenance of chromosomes protein 3 [Vitis vinifera]